MNKYKRSWQETLVFITDILTITFCYAAAYFIRFDGVPPEKYLNMMTTLLPLVLVVKMATLFYFELHKSIWQYASIKDLTQILKAASISSVSIIAATMVLQIGHPRSIFIIDWLLLVISLSGTRFIIRLTRPVRWQWRNGQRHRKKVLIVGAGHAGEMILREIIYGYGNNYEVAGLIDDDPKKYRKSIHGVSVWGASSDIPDIVKKKNVEEVIIAIPSFKPDQMRNIVNHCIKSGAKYRTVPNISDLVNGSVKVKALREVKLEDLLRRDEILLNRQRIEGFIKGKNVLITGAGGSIGSELCRQVAGLSPRKLILYEKSENALFYIDMELGQIFADLKKIPLIGNICDRKRVKKVFSEHEPQIIFHAAAHKHVPLMEINPMEAIKNNILGTKVIAEEAIQSGAEKFIMLSTDKAVDPSSFMGISKKISEMFVTAVAKKTETKFITVRFGNVLDSEGSVIPTFKRQIEKGGPVTVTHPDIKRYFMTIPEAVGLVIEAGFMGCGGEIFILEMGTQVKIVNLARDLIRLSGLEPDRDIEIVFTGLRPGEKMYEALVADDERLVKTHHEKIRVIESPGENGRNIFDDVSALEKIAEDECMDSCAKILKEIVPNYKPNLGSTPVSQKEKFTGREANILIADDENIVQELLCKFLEGKGYNTILASNGRKALDIVKKNNVPIAIIDIKMPGFMDGFSVLKNIKKINRDVKVILMTGFGSEKTRVLSSQLGAYAYLEKPLDLVDVRKYVEEALTTTNTSNL